MEPEQSSSSSLFDMQVDNLTLTRLNTVSTWARFVAISVIIMLACSVIFLTIARDKILDLFSKVLDFDVTAKRMLIALTMIGLAYFIVWFVFLLRAAAFIKQGIMTRNNDKLADGFKALKIFFTLSAIYSILSIIGSLIGMIIKF